MHGEPNALARSTEPHLPQVDEAVALSRVGGDVELLREVVALFLDDYPKSLDKLRTALATGDRSGVEHHAHSLKGSISTFGAQEAFDASFELEKKGRSGDLGDAENCLRRLERALTALHPELESIQSK